MASLTEPIIPVSLTHAVDGIEPGKVYGEYELYVLEHVGQPGVVLSVLLLVAMDEGRTITFRAARTLPAHKDKGLYNLLSRHIGELCVVCASM